MLKRLLYIIVFILAGCLNFLTLLPSFFLVLLWELIEVIYWVIKGKTITKEPLDKMQYVMWGAIFMEYFQKFLKLDDKSFI